MVKDVIWNITNPRTMAHALAMFGWDNEET